MSNIIEEVDKKIDQSFIERQINNRKEIKFICLNNQDYEDFKEEMMIKFGPITHEIFLKNSQYKNIQIYSDQALERGYIFIQFNTTNVMIDIHKLSIGNFIRIISRRGEVHLPTNNIFKVLQVSLIGDIEVLPVNDKPYKKEFIKLAQSDICFIPLTQDCIKNLGFHLEKTSVGFSKHYFNGDKFEVIRREDGVTEIRLQGSLVTTIMFVHELQNFYRFVCNKELILISNQQ